MLPLCSWNILLSFFFFFFGRFISYSLNVRNTKFPDYPYSITITGYDIVWFTVAYEDQSNSKLRWAINFPRVQFVRSIDGEIDLIWKSYQ